MPTMPDVPTLAEAGFPSATYTGWTGIVAPAGTPVPIIEKFYAALASVLTSEEGRAFFAGAGAEAGAERPEVFAAMLREDYARWGRVVREIGLKAD